MAPRDFDPHDEQAAAGRLLDRIAPRRPHAHLVAALADAWQATPGGERLAFLAQTLTAADWQDLALLPTAAAIRILTGPTDLV